MTDKQLHFDVQLFNFPQRAIPGMNKKSYSLTYRIRIPLLKKVKYFLFIYQLNAQILFDTSLRLSNEKTCLHKKITHCGKKFSS